MGAGVVLEPAGALAAAGLKRYALENNVRPGGTLVAVSSGANMDFETRTLLRLCVKATFANTRSDHNSVDSISLDATHTHIFLYMCKYYVILSSLINPSCKGSAALCVRTSRYL